MIFGTAQWIPETSIAELVVPDCSTLEDYYEYLAEETRLLEERPAEPIYLLLDVRSLGKVPRGILRSIRRYGQASTRIQAVAVVGTQSLFSYLIGIAARSNRLIVADSREAALAALTSRMMHPATD
jgi:hypothetical protein